MSDSNAPSVITDQAIWDTYVESANGHLLQSFGWGRLKSSFGWTAGRVAWQRGTQIFGAAQVLNRRLAPALTLAYVPRGPVLSQASDTRRYIEGLVHHARARGAFVLKLEPDWLKGDEREQLLQELQFRPSSETIQPPTTIHIDLTADLDTILARVKSKWRYNIRLAEKKGVTVRRGGIADFVAFYDLMRLTGERDRFAIHGANYYRTAFELLQAGDHVRLLIAEFDAKPLAMIFVTAFGREAIYLYGASGNEERNRMPNHALHWAAIRWAKERGCTHYDLWGVPELMVEAGEDANLPSSLYRFKQGFGGETVRYTGAWDHVFSATRHRVYQLARRAYKRGMG